MTLPVSRLTASSQGLTQTSDSTANETRWPAHPYATKRLQALPCGYSSYPTALEKLFVNFLMSIASIPSNKNKNKKTETKS